MDVYQHDGAELFRFDLRGELTGDEVQSVEHAWTTAKSILAGKELIVEVSGVTNVDSSGVDLLSRMRAAGARLTAAAAPKSKELLRFLGLPLAVAQRERRGATMALALLRLIRL
jgi:ABC-type transporter Mla MlaB component